MIIKRKNHTLVEVAIAVRFDPSKNDWDSTYFGKFYERIKDLGFVEKEEKKVIEVEFKDHEDSDGMPTPNTKVSDIQMVFKNKQKNSAIVLGSNIISFNQLEPYNGWEAMMNEIAIPALNIYKEIGLGNGILQVNSLYLNKFELPESERLATYFNFMPTFNEMKDGYEESLNFKSHYKIDDNIDLRLSLDGGLNQNIGKKIVFFECSCFVKNNNESFEQLSNTAHIKARNIFIELTKTV